MPASASEITVHVELGPRSYEIVIGSGLLSQAAPRIDAWIVAHAEGASAQRSRTALVVTDGNVADTHAAQVLESLKREGWTCARHVLEPGEGSKSPEGILGIYDALIEQRADRQTVVVVVGGGVVGDAAGFVAATYARGIPFVQVPTTLLADVDSSVGGKVGINHPRAKNMIGAFHQPLGVLIDTDALATLPDRDYRSGLAEVVKYGVILDSGFFTRLEGWVEELNRRDPDVLRDVIARSCRLKADVVEQDEFERSGLRAVLNYGHTFAHAYEALCGYGALQHGEAVSIGMLAASRLAERLGRIPSDVTERQYGLLAGLQLPVALPPELEPAPAELLERMRLDKKAVAGRLRFILPTRLGHVELVRDVNEADVLAVLESPA